MPNWCNNRLLVEGKSSDIEALVEFVKGKDEDGADMPLDFNKIIPMPPELLEEAAPIQKEHKARQHKKEYGAADWYDWRVKNWGTKWNLCAETELDLPSSGVAIFTFDTAWSPPMQIVSALGKRFPKLNFNLLYCELGNGFAGSFEVHGSKGKDTEFNSEKNMEAYASFVKNEFGYDEFFDEEEEEEE